jgi:hypothetical protein
VAATAALATLATGLHRGDVAGVLLGASVGVRAWELVSLDAQGVERFGLDALELARGNALVDDRAAGDGDRHGLAVELDDLDELHRGDITTPRWRRGCLRRSWQDVYAQLRRLAV